jgi:tripeptidyl-peptidase-1
MSKTQLIFATLAFAVLAVSARVFVEFSSNIQVPSGWKRLDNARSEQRVQLIFALKQNNVEKLEKIFWEVSDPAHPKYGKHLSLKQVADLVSPSQAVVNKVIAWLASHGVTKYSIPVTQDFVKVTVTAKKASDLLATTFHQFMHINTGKTTVRAIQPYSLPEDIAPHVDFVGGVHRFPQMNRLKYRTDMDVDVVPKAMAPTSNSPMMVYLQAGDAELGALFLVRCKDGSNAMDASNPCSNKGDAVSSFQFSATNPDLPTQTMNIPFNNLQCSQCRNWGGNFFSKCNGTDTQFGYSDSSVYCFYAFNNLPNYVPLNYTITTTYQSGAQSSSYSYGAPIYLSRWVLPQTLQQTYGVPLGLTNRNEQNQGQSVSEFLGEYYSPTDLSQFFALAGLTDEKVDYVYGPNDVNNPGGEASLDIQYLMGVSRNVTTWFLSYGDLHEGQEPFLEWLTQLTNTGIVPFVHSTSYADEEPTLTINYMNRVNIELIKNGARGLSFLFSAGDDGVGGYSLRTNPNACSIFRPEFPSSSPYVTAVGGTQYMTNIYPICHKVQFGESFHCNEVGEVASSSLTGSRITTGGGFSINFGRPAYQQEAVNTFLTSQAANLPSSQYYNASNRAYPDISAIAHNYLVIIAGQIVPIDGTSASTPVVAALLTLLNDYQLSQGRSPLGFVNPLLYSVAKSNPEAYFDVVVGENRCSAIPTMCCPETFTAAPGWDPVTGLGTPNFAIFKQVLDQLAF